MPKHWEGLVTLKDTEQERSPQNIDREGEVSDCIVHFSLESQMTEKDLDV